MCHDGKRADLWGELSHEHSSEEVIWNKSLRFRKKRASQENVTRVCKTNTTNKVWGYTLYLQVADKRCLPEWWEGEKDTGKQFFLDSIERLPCFVDHLRLECLIASATRCSEVVRSTDTGTFALAIELWPRNQICSYGCDNHTLF